MNHETYFGEKKTELRVMWSGIARLHRELGYNRKLINQDEEMLRITKLSEYGTLLLTQMALMGVGKYASAREIANISKIPLPMVSKILKLLVQGELLQSLRGVNGGYSLSRPPHEIYMLDIVQALEGDVHLTYCSQMDTPLCPRIDSCVGHRVWPRINQQFVQVLKNTTLGNVLEDLTTHEQLPLGGD